MPVHDRRVVEQREHAAGQVGAGDRESVGQVAVDRGAVGSPGGFAGQRGRPEDRPVQVAFPDLFLAAAHVGADMPEERAPHHGLEQVAQIGAFGFVGGAGGGGSRFCPWPWMMLRTLSWMTVVGPVPRGPTAEITASAPARAGLIEAGSMTSAVTVRSRGWAGTARRAGSRTTAVTS